MQQLGAAHARDIDALKDRELWHIIICFRRLLKFPLQSQQYAKHEEFTAAG